MLIAVQGWCVTLEEILERSVRVNARLELFP